MRRFLFLAVIAAALTALPAGSATAAPPGAPFSGHWEAIDDPIDSSNLDMHISPALKVSMKDDFTTICGGAKSIAKGQATSGPGANQITVTLTMRCLGPGGGSIGAIGTFTFTYDPGTDTLTGFSAPDPWIRA